MRRTLVSLSFGLLLCGLSACGGRPHPKITRIEAIFSNGPTVRPLIMEADYADDRIDEATWTANGQLSFTGDFFYFDDKLLTDIELKNANDYLFGALQYIHQSGELIEKRRYDESTAVSWAVQYDDDRIKSISTREKLGDSSVSGSREYAYSDGRLVGISIARGSERTGVNVVRSGDQIDRIEVQSGGSVFGINYEYSDGQVTSVTAPQGEHYTITYLDEGIDIIEGTLTDGSTVFVSYFYGDGEVAGLHPVGAFPFGDYFDIQGRPFESAELTAFDFFID